MIRERDALVKRVFPELRRRCRERQVDLVDVDLRWGITNEQSQQGETLSICLQEVARCRPYFICLLGERYGSIAREIPLPILHDEPWIEQFLHKSLTELEVQHGVLRAPEMARRAFFYFRDSRYGDLLPPEEAAVLEESPAPEEVSTFGREEAERRATGRRRLLGELKDHIRQTGLPLRENYPDPSVLGEMVLEDLWRAIESDFPAEEVMDPLARERREHEIFAQTRWGLYVGAEQNFEKIDRYLRRGVPALLITGPAGAGKSALLANWVRQRRENRPREFVFLHFIGATPGSSDLYNLVRRLGLEILRHLQLPQSPPAADDELMARLPDWLSLLAASAREQTSHALIILDALDQLNESGNGQDLSWWPENVPPGVQLVISAQGGHALEAAARRDWPSEQVQPLSLGESTELISSYLRPLRKTLTKAHVERILAHPSSSSPLFLHTLLHELRLGGEHHRLEEQLSVYLQTSDVPALLDLVLRRWEEDYNPLDVALVQSALPLLLASRDGLSESELTILLRRGDEVRLPAALWAPFALALADYTVSRDGLLNFFHADLRRAAERRYLSEDGARKSAHLALAGFFRSLEPCTRQAAELPLHLLQSGLKGELPLFLADLECASLIVRRSEFDLLRFWRSVGGETAMIENYRAAIEQWAQSAKPPAESAEVMSTMGAFFALTRHDGLAQVALLAALAARMRVLQGKYPQKKSRSEWGILSGREVEMGPFEIATLRNLCRMAEVYERQGEVKASAEYFAAALVPAHHKLGPSDLMTLRIQRAITASRVEMLLQNPSYVSLSHENSRLQNMLRGFRSQLPLEHPETIEVEVMLATVLALQGEAEPSRQLLEHALGAAERLFGTDHLTTVNYRLRSYDLSQLR